MIDDRELARMIRVVGVAMRDVGATYLCMEGLTLQLGDAPMPAATLPEETKQTELDLPPAVGSAAAEPRLEDLLFASSAG